MEKDYISALKDFFRLGDLTANRAITILFYLGIVPVAIQSYLIGTMVSAVGIQRTHTYIVNGQRVTSSSTVNNDGLGFLVGLAAFVFLLILLKVTL